MVTMTISIIYGRLLVILFIRWHYFSSSCFIWEAAIIFPTPLKHASRKWYDSLLLQPRITQGKVHSDILRTKKSHKFTMIKNGPIVIMFSRFYVQACIFTYRLIYILEELFLTNHLFPGTAAKVRCAWNGVFSDEAFKWLHFNCWSDTI